MGCVPDMCLTKNSGRIRIMYYFIDFFFFTYAASRPQAQLTILRKPNITIIVSTIIITIDIVSVT